MTALNPRLRIQVTTSTGWGGRESLPLAIHRSWTASGIPSLLLAGEGTPLTTRGEGHVEVVPRSRLGLARAVRSIIRRQWDTHTPAPTVISHFTHDLGSLRWALRGMPDARMIVIKHVSPGPPKSDPLHRWIYNRVDCLLGVSKFVADKCLTSYPVSHDRIGVWHPGVDTDRFAFDKDARRDVRARHAATDDHIVFGYVGRVTPNKGLEWLLDAFSALSPDFPNARLWIVGGASADERSYEDALKQEVAGRRHGDRVLFTGYQESVGQYMSALDVFVTPSCEESFGLTTVEAMMAARPVVGFDTAGTGEIVVDGDTGILADANGDRVEDLGAALRQSLRDTDLLQALGQAGQQRAAGLFSHQAMIDRLEAHLT